MASESNPPPTTTPSLLTLKTPWCSQHMMLDKSLGIRGRGVPAA